MPLRLRSLAFLAVPAVVITACGGDESEGAADFSGNYSVAVTNRTNDCQYDGFEIGKSAQNVAFEISQSGSTASGKMTGLAGDFYLFLFGIGTLQGEVVGDTVSLSSVGTAELVKNGCKFFVRAQIDATITGDAVNGTVTYSNETAEMPQCQPLSGCTSTQALSGNRPPK